MNRVFLIGRLGLEPELRATQGGNSVLRLRLATSERWKDKATGEQKEATEWHTIVLWGNRAEALNKILSKGDRICVEGKITHRSWEDKDGNKRTTTEVRATDVHLLGGGSRDGRPRQSQESRGGDYGGDLGNDYSSFAEDDIPFLPEDEVLR